MTRAETKQKYIRFTGIANHLDSLYKRMWAQFVITPNESYYIMDGKKVSESEMDAVIPYC